MLRGAVPLSDTVIWSGLLISHLPGGWKRELMLSSGVEGSKEIADTPGQSLVMTIDLNLQQAAEQANSLDPKKMAEVMHSGKSFNTVLGEMSYDKKGDVTGYTVGGKKKDRYVLYIWKKGPDGKITYVETQ